MPRRLTTQAWWVLRQVCAVVLGVFVYFRVRGLTVARPSVALRHANDVLAFEHRFHLDQERHLNSLAHGGTDLRLVVVDPRGVNMTISRP